jgi:anti-sigma factor RsiW
VRRKKMTCREFVGLIPAYRNGELNRADRQSFSQHTRECGRCAEYLKAYEQTVNATRRIGEDSRAAEPTMPKSLVSRILRNRLKQWSGS